MNFWWKAFFVLIFIVVLSILFYFFVYVPYLSQGTSHVYYSGFWLNGYLYPAMTNGTNYGNKDFLKEGSANTNVSTDELEAQWQTYSSYSTLALCVGTYDPSSNMTSGGGFNGDSTGSISNVDPISTPTTGSSVGNVTLVTTLYDPKKASSFKIYLNKLGELTSEVLGSEYICVATLDSSYYPSKMNVPSSTPPVYLAVAFVKKSDVSSSTSSSSTKYLKSKWKYGSNFTEVGSLATTTNDVSAANVFTCSVTLPSSLQSDASTDAVTYYLNAGGVYYLNRQANTHNLGAPAMLTLAFTDGVATSSAASTRGYYYSRIYSSVNLFWNTDSIVSLYSMMTNIHGGGICKNAVAINTGYNDECLCAKSTTTTPSPTLNCSKTCGLPTNSTGTALKDVISFGPWCEWATTINSSPYKSSSS